MSTAGAERVAAVNEPANRNAQNKGNGLLAAADQTLRGYDRFSKKLQKSSSYQKLIKKHAVEPDTANLDVLRDMLRRYLDDAKAAEARFDQRAGFSQRITQFLLTFKTYLDTYGSIVELMSQAAGEYGKAAYGTLLIFLNVAVSKQTRDNRIGEVLKQLCKQYTRFKILEEIHSTSEMQMYLAEAYKVGIDFARYAVFYYLRSRLGRVWSVVANPPALYEEALAEITAAMNDIQAEGAILDSKRLHKVDHGLGSLQRTVTRMDVRHVELERMVQDLWKTQWNARLEDLRDKILPYYQSAADAIDDYQVRLDATFDSQRRDITSRLPELRDSEAHRRWSRSHKSSFLVVRGEARCLTHFCWFSPLILRLFRELRQADEVTAFHCCQVMDSSEPGDRFAILLGHLAFQILESMPHPPNPTSLKSIWRRVDDSRWGKDPAVALDVLAEILPTLKKVTMIIDRADLLRGDWEDCISRFCQLASGRVSQHCVVKIILVGSCITSDWRSLNEKMIGLVGEEQVFQLDCSESDWKSWHG